MALRAARQRTMSDLDTTEALTAQDAVFRFEDAGPTETRSELVAAAQSMRAAIGGTGREFVDIWEIGDGTVVAILDVHQVASMVVNRIACACNVFRANGGFVRENRSYLDVHPVMAP
jgi:hypothetical protein